LISRAGAFAAGNQPQSPASQPDQKMMKLTTIVLALMLGRVRRHSD
jgi:hypothetical protein